MGPHMKGLQGFTILLILQGAGEMIARLLHLSLPAPVIGMILLLPCLAWKPLREPVQVCSEFLLSHLSLLFVPISVGVITQLPLLEQYGSRVLLVLSLSTLLGLAVTALVLRALLRGTPADQGERARE